MRAGTGMQEGSTVGRGGAEDSFQEIRIEHQNVEIVTGPVSP